MQCSDDKCENDNAVPFVIFRKDLSAERQAFCPKHLNKFRRAHGNEIQEMRVFYGISDARTTMAEFSGLPARRPRL
jgi:hypothetical protein